MIPLLLSVECIVVCSSRERWNDPIHHTDLWVLHLAIKTWEQVKSSRGPLSQGNIRWEPGRHSWLFLLASPTVQETAEKMTHMPLTWACSHEEAVALREWGHTQARLPNVHPPPGDVTIYGGHWKTSTRVDQDILHSNKIQGSLRKEERADGYRPGFPLGKRAHSLHSQCLDRCGLNHQQLLLGCWGVCGEGEEESLRGDYFDDLRFDDTGMNHWFVGPLQECGSETKKCKWGRKKKKESETQGCLWRSSG